MVPSCKAKCTLATSQATCTSSVHCDWGMGICYPTGCGVVNTPNACSATYDFRQGKSCEWNYRRNFCSIRSYDFAPKSTELPTFASCDRYGASAQCFNGDSLMHINVTGGGLIASTPLLNVGSDEDSTCGVTEHPIDGKCASDVAAVFASRRRTDDTQAMNYTMCEKYLPMFSSEMGPITPGVYCAVHEFTALASSPLVFDAQGNPNATFVIVSNFTFYLHQNMTLTGQAQARNIFWIGDRFTFRPSMPDAQMMGSFLFSQSVDVSQRVRIRGQLLHGSTSTTRNANVNVTAPTTIEWASCVMSEWADTGVCNAPSCGTNGTIRQQRSIITQGPNCPTDTVRNVTCLTDQCPIDCQLSTWTNGTCSVTCGEGVVIATRNITVEAKHGGRVCDSNREEILSCRLPPCVVNCSTTPWIASNVCSVSCGGGYQNQTRTMLLGTPQCSLELQRAVTCNTHACVADDSSFWSMSIIIVLAIAGGVVMFALLSHVIRRRCCRSIPYATLTPNGESDKTTTS